MSVSNIKPETTSDPKSVTVVFTLEVAFILDSFAICLFMSKDNEIRTDCRKLNVVN